MEILACSNSLLCNYEINEILEEKRQQRPGVGSNLDLQSRENIETKLLKYFRENNNSKKMEVEKVNEFMNELNEANISITKAEYMVLLNHLPQTPVEIYLTIEECAERLNDDQVQFVIDCIKKHFLS